MDDFLTAEHAGVDHPELSSSLARKIDHFVPGFQEQIDMGRAHTAYEALSQSAHWAAIENALREFKAHSDAPNTQELDLSDADLSLPVTQSRIIHNGLSPADCDKLLVREIPQPLLLELIALPLPAGYKERFEAKAGIRPRVLDPGAISRGERMKLAENPETSEADLKALITQAADAKDNGLIEAVFRNPAIGPQVLGELSKNPNEAVRALVAQNSKTPPEALTILSKDTSEFVREKIAENTKTPIPVLTEMAAKDFCYFVFSNMTQNPSATPEILGIIMTRLKKSSKPNTELKGFIAKHANTSLELRTDLSMDSSITVRKSIAEATDTPAAILSTMAKDTDSGIRKIVAEHPNTPMEALQVLGTDSNRSVQDAAVNMIAMRNREVLTKVDMTQKGYKGKQAFDHSVVSVGKRVPGYELGQRGVSWVRYIDAVDNANEFPKDLFKVFNLHRIPSGNGKPLGWIGGKWDDASKTLFVTELQSDLLQRTQELNDARLIHLKPYKSKLENRFDGWEYVFFNQALKEAQKRGAEVLAVPDSNTYAVSVPGAKNIAKLYDKVVQAYPHTHEDGWYKITMQPGLRIAEKDNWVQAEFDSWVRSTEIFIKKHKDPAYDSPSEGEHLLEQLKEESEAYLDMSSGCFERFWRAIKSKLIETGVIQEGGFSLNQTDDLEPEQEQESEDSMVESLPTSDQILDLYEKARTAPEPEKSRILQQVRELSSRMGQTGFSLRNIARALRK